jgi:hypothetical protein
VAPVAARRCDGAWEASRALDAIGAIVRDVERHRLARGHWPVHPLDHSGDAPQAPFKSLYFGSAGVSWALWYLQREGAVTLAVDPAQDAARADADYLADPDTGGVVPSYFLGHVGILLVLWRLTGSIDAADRLHAAVRSNLLNPTNEALWAAPGTMVAAWHLWEATGQARWRDLYLDNVEQLWRTWEFDPRAQCHLWTQDLYGKVVQYLGAGHGFAGNAYALLKGATLLTPDRRATLYERCAATLRATSATDRGAVNWPPDTGTAGHHGTRMLMQWCHGAPGVVTGLSDCPVRVAPELDDLLIGAGQAIWTAGAVTKGYGLCHGTAGNGYAFLKLYRRTGDSLWLQRARAFGMHAMAQHDRMRRHYGHGRYSLWTGDAGLAVYLWHCTNAQADMPGLDILQ